MSVSRTFEDQPAVRSKVPLLVGLMGPTSSGKTYSALRIATGIQRVNRKPIYLIDTEAKRSLHHADKFRFNFVEFRAPFGPLDYLAAVEHCVRKGAGTIIIDSASHCHEGPGGVLEMHDQECERLMKAWRTDSREKVQTAAWNKPKTEFRRLINSMLQMPVDFILCFRAKEKVKPAKGGQMEELGFMPIVGDELPFELTVNMLLMPSSGGVPEWRPEGKRAGLYLKLPEQFRDIFAKSRPLDEAHGEAMAKWAAGGTADAGPQRQPSLNELLTAMGKDSLDSKLEWVGDRLGRPIVSADELKKLAPDEVSRLVELAKGEGK